MEWKTAAAITLAAVIWSSGAAKGMGGDSVGNYTPKLSARLVIELDDSTGDRADDR